MYCKIIFFLNPDTTLIRDEKLQYDINKEAAKTSALLSGKRYKHEYLTGE